MCMCVVVVVVCVCVWGGRGCTLHMRGVRACEWGAHQVSNDLVMSWWALGARPDGSRATLALALAHTSVNPQVSTPGCPTPHHHHPSNTPLHHLTTTTTTTPSTPPPSPHLNAVGARLPDLSAAMYMMTWGRPGAVGDWASTRLAPQAARDQLTSPSTSSQAVAPAPQHVCHSKCVTAHNTCVTACVSQHTSKPQHTCQLTVQVVH